MGFQHFYHVNNDIQFIVMDNWIFKAFDFWSWKTSVCIYCAVVTYSRFLSELFPHSWSFCLNLREFVFFRPKCWIICKYNKSSNVNEKSNLLLPFKLTHECFLIWHPHRTISFVRAFQNYSRFIHSLFSDLYG